MYKEYFLVDESTPIVYTLEFESGLTKINAVGGYSGIERTVIYFVVNRFQITKMREIISEIDPSAFIALHDITDVFSENQ